MKSVFLMLVGAFCALALFVCGCGKKAADDDTAPPETKGGAAASAMQLPPGSTAFGQDPGQGDPNAVLVTVAGKSLTRGMASGLARQIASRKGVRPEMLATFITQQAAQLEKEAVEQFIGETLLSAEAERLAIPVSTQEVDDVVARMSKSLPEGLTLEQALARQGKDVAEFRRGIESNERVRKLFESKTEATTPPTDEEVEAFYNENADRFKTKEQVEARHILIPCDASADEEAHAKAKAQADDLLKQVREGGDFAELAKANSSCPSKNRGGSLGSFQKGKMVPPFDEAAFSREVDELGPVVKTRFGYHVLQVTGKQEAGSRSLEEVSGDIRRRLAAKAKNEAFGAYIETLREKADIEYAAETAAAP